MIRLNPEIEKFWREAGYDIDTLPLGGDNELPFFHASVSEGLRLISSKLIANTKKINGKQVVTYFLNGKAYSEKDFLKLIKMKAFI